MSATTDNPSFQPTAPVLPRQGGGLGKWILLFVVLAAVIVGGLLWMRSREHVQLVDATHDLANQYVNVTRPSAGAAENDLVLPGNLMAFNEASIYARTSGYLKAWYTDIGAKVTCSQRRLPASRSSTRTARTSTR